MRIYGVDLGTRRIAVACPEISLVWSYDLTVGPGSAARGRRYKAEHDAGRHLGVETGLMLNAWDGGVFKVDQDVVFVAERPFVGRPHGNINTAIGQSLSAGSAAAMLPGRTVLVRQASWKEALSGHGNLSKPDLRRWIEDRHPALAEACGEDEDRYSAIGIALGASVMAERGDL